MTPLLLGLVAAVVVIMGLRWLANADVKAMRKSLQWTAIGLLALVVVGLGITGRLGAALALLAGLVAWAFRIMSMVHMGRQFHGMFRSFGFGGGFGGGSGAGMGSPQSSRVDSAYLRMSLDHATGAMDGEILQGHFQGKRLSGMSRADLVAALAEMQADADSARLMEAYLDRAHPEWREDAGDKSPRQPGAPPGVMSADEAYRILGLAPGASESDIKAAYRRLMSQLHPDHGGTDYLAAKVNQAKDVLLK